MRGPARSDQGLLGDQGGLVGPAPRGRAVYEPHTRDRLTFFGLLAILTAGGPPRPIGSKLVRVSASRAWMGPPHRFQEGRGCTGEQLCCWKALTGHSLLSAIQKGNLRTWFPSRRVDSYSVTVGLIYQPGSVIGRHHATRGLSFLSATALTGKEFGTLPAGQAAGEVIPCGSLSTTKARHQAYDRRSAAACCCCRPSRPFHCHSNNRSLIEVCIKATSIEIL